MNSLVYRLALCAAMALAVACDRSGERASVESQGEADRAQPTKLADSLALRTDAGIEVWLTDSRVATGSDGAPCIERVMEIRHDGERIAVPLLYTGEIPALVNDSTIRAHIWLNCQPGNTYDVNLQTGEPRRVR